MLALRRIFRLRSPLAAIAGCLVSATAVPGDAQGVDPLTSCILVGAASAERGAAASAQPRPIAPRELTRGQRRALAPIGEDEVERLVELLRPVSLEDGSGVRLRGMTGRSGISHERAGALLADVTNLLASLHAREGLEQLEAAEMEPETRSWLEARLRAIDGCVRATFEARGGDPAYRASIAIVERFRTQLESLVLGRLGTDGTPPRPESEAAQPPGTGSRPELMVIP